MVVDRFPPAPYPILRPRGWRSRSRIKRGEFYAPPADEAASSSTTSWAQTDEEEECRGLRIAPRSLLAFKRSALRGFLDFFSLATTDQPGAGPAGDI
ncbi:hypothetical protein KM043_001129 [Ampulex compressa]|nr:hypothetical protein KM043_001129 [Ampulex compressa]